MFGIEIEVRSIQGSFTRILKRVSITLRSLEKTQFSYLRFILLNYLKITDQMPLSIKLDRCSRKIRLRLTSSFIQ